MFTVKMKIYIFQSLLWISFNRLSTFEEHLCGQISLIQTITWLMPVLAAPSIFPFFLYFWGLVSGPPRALTQFDGNDDQITPLVACFFKDDCFKASILTKVNVLQYVSHVPLYLSTDSTHYFTPWLKWISYFSRMSLQIKKMHINCRWCRSQDNTQFYTQTQNINKYK